MTRNLAHPFLRRALVLALVLVGLCAPQTWGQITGQGTIAVKVLDPSGATVPDAKLTLEDLATSRVRTAVAESSGSYSFVALTVGTQSTQVTVSGQAPVVEKTSNAITGSIDLGQVEDLPVIGRDISQLSRIVPGAVSNGGYTTWNGMPLAATGNNIDGVIATTSRMKFGGASEPLVEARIEDMQEMTVQTDQLNTNTGFGQSNFQVNFVTRRGSNTFHGRLFEDHRSSALNANSWVNDASGAAKPKYH